jgi:hypothetical protein
MDHIDQFINDLPSNLRKTASAIREIILSSSPAIEEKFSYKVPFYHYMGALCYINKNKDSVYIGFVKGNQLEDEYDLLEKGDRKQIRIINFKSVTGISQQQLRFFLNQAMLLNELNKKARST